MNWQLYRNILTEYASQIQMISFAVYFFENPSRIKRKKNPKGPLTTQYVGGIAADQLFEMATTIIGPKTKYSTISSFKISVNSNSDIITKGVRIA